MGGCQRLSHDKGIIGGIAPGGLAICAGSASLSSCSQPPWPGPRDTTMGSLSLAGFLQTATARGRVQESCESCSGEDR